MKPAKTYTLALFYSTNLNISTLFEPQFRDLQRSKAIDTRTNIFLIATAHGSLAGGSVVDERLHIYCNFARLSGEEKKKWNLKQHAANSTTTLPPSPSSCYTHINYRTHLNLGLEKTPERSC